MNKQTVYIPIDSNESELIVTDGEKQRIAFPVKETKAYVFTSEELKELLSDAFDAGVRYEVDDNPLQLNMEEYIEKHFKKKRND